MLLSIIFFWISGLLKSRYLYFNRTSSLVWLSSSMGKGGVSDSERIRILSAATSISPVFKFSFTAAERFCTNPSTAMTNSFLKVPAFKNPSSPTVSWSNTICRIPERSLKSTKISAPKFLLFCTHPITVTFSPIFSVETSVHLWVLFNPCIDSAIFSLLTSLDLFYLLKNSWIS